MTSDRAFHDRRAPALPQPSRTSRWRWASTGRALVGGGALAAALSLGGAAAGDSTTHAGAPPGSAGHGAPPDVTKKASSG
jgi:hypothetical protein